MVYFLTDVMNLWYIFRNEHIVGQRRRIFSVYTAEYAVFVFSHTM